MEQLKNVRKVGDIQLIKLKPIVKEEKTVDHGQGEENEESQ